MTHDYYFYYIVILAVLLVIILIISAKTNMLRNVPFNCDNFDQIAAKKNLANPKLAFSLGRTQLAFWSIIVIGSYVYVFLFSKESPNIAIPGVNLILMGIAAGTTTVAKVIDNNQQDAAASNNNATKVQQDIPSKGFFTDIISDETGVSIHRLQNVIWTIVVGGVYIDWVCSNTCLPNENTITNTLLGLMGISSAAYLGVKTTENTTPTQPDAQGAVANQGGNQGAQGAQGPQGAPGDAGAQGAQGAIGADGSQGDQGPQGSLGDQGAQGQQGPQGAQGS
jgi:hypothetical protein